MTMRGRSRVPRRSPSPSGTSARTAHPTTPAFGGLVAGGFGNPSRVPKSIEARDDRRVIAGAVLAVGDAADRAGGERLAGEHVVDAPAQVALAQVAPGRPPGEELLVGGIQPPRDVAEPVA